MRKLLIATSLLVSGVAFGTLTYIGLDVTTHIPLLFAVTVLVMVQATMLLTKMRRYEQ